MSSSNIQQRGQSLQILAHEFIDLKDALSRSHRWDETDARLTVFNKFSNLCNSTCLGYVFIDKYLTNIAWWQSNNSLPFTLETIKNTVNEYEMSLRIMLIQSAVYSLDSSFRIFVKSIDQHACNDGMAEFKSIYDWLLKKTNLKKHSELLDLLREIRNTMHNNGLYYPVNGKDKSITYNGVTCSFRVGEHLHFVDTEFVIQLVSDTKAMLKDLVESQEASSLTRVSEVS